MGLHWKNKSGVIPAWHLGPGSAACVGPVPKSMVQQEKEVEANVRIKPGYGLDDFESGS